MAQYLLPVFDEPLYNVVKLPLGNRHLSKNGRCIQPFFASKCTEDDTAFSSQQDPSSNSQKKGIDWKSTGFSLHRERQACLLFYC